MPGCPCLNARRHSFGLTNVAWRSALGTPYAAHPMQAPHACQTPVRTLPAEGRGAATPMVEGACRYGAGEGGSGAGEAGGLREAAARAIGLTAAGWRPAVERRVSARSWDKAEAAMSRLVWEAGGGSRQGGEQGEAGRVRGEGGVRRGR